MSTHLRLTLVFVLVLGDSRAEDARVPHQHQGIFRRYTPGPPEKAGLLISDATKAKLLSGSCKPECTITSLPESATSPKGTMRCSSVQLVHTPPTYVWKTLLNFGRYPEFVGGISACTPYSKRRTLSNGKVVCAKYTVGVGPMYKIRYFVEHHYEPLQHSLVWCLDYSRQSDVFDTVGYWHVEAAGPSSSLVYYTQDTLLPNWIPSPLKKTFTKVAMRSATAQLEPTCMKLMNEANRQPLWARRPAWGKGGGAEAEAGAEGKAEATAEAESQGAAGIGASWAAEALAEAGEVSEW